MSVDRICSKGLLAVGVFAAVLCSVGFLLPGQWTQSSMTRPAIQTAATTCSAASVGPPPAPVPGGAPLRFGIYPGGGAGGSGTAKPDDPRKRLGALSVLRGDRPFVIRLYEEFTGSPTPDRYSAAVEGQISTYTKLHYDVELAINYRPTSSNTRRNVATFALFLRRLVNRLGPNRGLRWIQVANEVDLTPPIFSASADGSFPGAEEALIAGVEAAKAQAVRDKFSQLRIGINWVEEGPNDAEFWTTLGEMGGERFVHSVDWVGLDAYPASVASAASRLIDDMEYLRACYLPLAHIPATVPLLVVENGFATGPGRTDQMQSQAMTASVEAVNTYRATFNVTDYQWFDLRDAASQSANVADHYGIMTDRYQPKIAFSTFKKLVVADGG
jgi:hypothetical protein